MKNKQPIAHITVQKNRQKKGDKVYLKNGTEFEIELYNPTQNTVLARIWINDSEMNGGGIVIKPAQRVHLERYLDNDRKFLFETYNVSGSESEIKEAIKKNGLVKIKFYNEDTSPQHGFNPQIWNNDDWKKHFYNDPNYQPVFGQRGWNNDIIGSGTGSPTYGNLFNCTMEFNDGVFDISGETTVTDKLSFVNCSTSNLEDETSYKSKTKTLEKRSKKPKETGRIESGSKSEQSFEYVTKAFSSSYTAEYEYQLLPISERVYDSTEVKSNIYCTECGRKQKKSQWKFCPNCSTKFN